MSAGPFSEDYLASELIAIGFIQVAISSLKTGAFARSCSNRLKETVFVEDICKELMSCPVFRAQMES